MEYTLNQFALELCALLRKAEDANLAVDDFCAVAETILENGWGEDAEAHYSND